MELKTKNLLSVAFLGLIAFGIYLYALPSEVIEAIGKAIKNCC